MRILATLGSEFVPCFPSEIRAPLKRQRSVKPLKALSIPESPLSESGRNMALLHAK
jgi:hypothetical protein